MTISLFVLLIPYVIFLGIWGFLSLVGFYHLARYGGRHCGTYIIGLMYLLGCLVLLQLSYMYLVPIDWSHSITLFQSATVPTTFDNF